MPKLSHPRKIFAEKVRAMRKIKGISQEKLAEKANVHRTYIGMVERAETNISVESMFRIAKALGCDLKTLL